MRRVLVGEVPSLTALEPACPPALEEVVRRCLERDPSRRFASVTDLVTALTAAAPQITPASDEAVAALVDEALGETLTRRRRTIAATVNAESTATGEVDVDALIASGRAMMGEGMTAPLPTPSEPLRERGTFVESETLPLDEAGVPEWTDPPDVSDDDDRAAAAQAAETAASTAPPPRRRHGTAAIALLAALGGASISWIVARSSDDAPSAASSSPSMEATAPPSPTDAPSAAPSASESSSAPLVPTASASASGSAAPIGRRPVPRRAPRKPVPPSGTAKPDEPEVVVPDNPYR
jgi:serine/threonine-protein kinase